MLKQRFYCLSITREERAAVGKYNKESLIGTAAAAAAVVRVQLIT